MHIPRVDISGYWMEESLIITQRKHVTQSEDTDRGEIVEVEVLIKIGSSESIQRRERALEV